MDLGRRLTSGLVLLFLYAGSSPCGTPLTIGGWPGAQLEDPCWSGCVNLPIIHYSVYWWSTLHRSSTNLQQTIDPSMRLPLRICIFLTVGHPDLMRLHNLILQLERRRPWVVALVGVKEPPDEPRLFIFRRLPEYGRLCRVYVWLAVAVTVAAFGLLTVHTLWARQALFHECERASRRERRIAPLANMTKEARGCKRVVKPGCITAVLAGLRLTVSLTLYA